MTFPGSALSPQWTVTGEEQTTTILEARVTAQLNAIRTYLFATNTYTPTWTSTGTAPAIGNGAYSGSYSLIGHEVTGWGAVILGSTSTVGTGNYLFALPTAANASIPVNTPVGILTFVHSATVYTRTLCLLTTTTVYADDPSGVNLSASSPAVPASGDKFLLNLSYLSA